MRFLSVSASPGKQITLPQSLITPSSIIGMANSGATATGATSSILNEMNKSPSSTSSATSVSAPKTTEKVEIHLEAIIYIIMRKHVHARTLKLQQKEKKDKCVSLMRRLTNIKKSKSPPPTTYSMDNPVFDDGNSINPVHVR